MHATARTLQYAEAPAAPAAPRLHEVPTARRRRPPRAATAALSSLGLPAGFLLAAVASAPGGGAVVAGQLKLALAGAVVGGLALLRARAVTRRRALPGTRAAAL